MAKRPHVPHIGLGRPSALLVAGLSISLASAAAAQDGHVGGIADDAIAGGNVRAAPAPDSDAPAKAMKPDLLVVPIPLSNPTLGTGLTLAGVLFYNPNGSSQPWVTGVGGMYSSNKSWGGAAFHSMSLAKDKFRVIAFGGYADIKMKFYGIGPNAGARGISIGLDDRGAAALLQGQFRLAPHFYAGARYEFLDIKTRINRENPRFPDAIPPDSELRSRLSAIGPAITFDTRDKSFGPHKGVLLTAVGMFNIKGLGSDFSYNKWQLAANAYLPVQTSSTLAVHASLCGVSKGGPFYDLCMYGQGGDLRGYEAGRYRDRASWTVQAEWRQHLGGKFGAVFFGGIGGIAPSLGDLDQTEFLPSAGMGLRYLASKEAGVNLRLDFAMGKDSQAVYFGIAEVF